MMGTYSLCVREYFMHKHTCIFVSVIAPLSRTIWNIYSAEAAFCHTVVCVYMSCLKSEGLAHV